jgi:hypothetical protein
MIQVRRILLKIGHFIVKRKKRFYFLEMVLLKIFGMMFMASKELLMVYLLPWGKFIE